MVTMMTSLPILNSTGKIHKLTTIQTRNLLSTAETWSINSWCILRSTNLKTSKMPFLSRLWSRTLSSKLMWHSIMVRRVFGKRALREPTTQKWSRRCKMTNLSSHTLLRWLDPRSLKLAYWTCLTKKVFRKLWSASTNLLEWSTQLVIPGTTERTKLLNLACWVQLNSTWVKD